MPLVRLLGPVDVVDDSGVVRTPGSPLRRTLLALLALDRGHVVTADQLLDRAWDGEPPASGVRALRFHISKLRAELDIDDLIVTVGSGYRLDADTDLARVHAPTDGADIDDLESVLAAWRGQPFHDASPCLSLDSERERIDLRRLLIVEALHRARVDVGDTSGIPDLERLCLAHPLRESVWAVLVTAHYVAGDQAEALRTIARLRVNLREELGVDPSPEIGRLEQQILDHDLSVEPAPGRPSTATIAGNLSFKRMDGEMVLPSGTVTFMFTDVEGSSRLWDEYPLQMRDAVEQHDAVVASTISANGGYVFTAGGGSFAATFQTAESAAQAALEIQAAIAAAEWSPQARLRVRIGLHTGEAHERNGDYYGPAVNRTARIEAAARGQQVLVSEVTAEVLAGSTSTNWVLTDLGDHALWGLSQPVRIHQLGAGVFPPLRTDISSRSISLPARVSLIGRENEAHDVAELWTLERLVTLTGPGGIGKTSLATEVAHRFAASLAEALWWCDLVLATPTELVRTISNSVGIEDAALDVDGLTAALRRRGTTRLVLDNCEHVLDSVSRIVDELLSGCDVSILATSRHPIGLTSETLFAVAPLSRTGSSVELFERVMRRVGAAHEVD